MGRSWPRPSTSIQLGVRGVISATSCGASSAPSGRGGGGGGGCTRARKCRMCWLWLFCTFGYLLFLCFCSVCVYLQVMSFCKCVSIIIKYIIPHGVLGVISVFVSRYFWQIVGRKCGLLTSKARWLLCSSCGAVGWSLSHRCIVSIYITHASAQRLRVNLTSYERIFDIFIGLEMLLTWWPTRGGVNRFFVLFAWEVRALCDSWIYNLCAVYSSLDVWHLRRRPVASCGCGGLHVDWLAAHELPNSRVSFEHAFKICDILTLLQLLYT